LNAEEADWGAAGKPDIEIDVATSTRRVRSGSENRDRIPLKTNTVGDRFDGMQDAGPSSSVNFNYFVPGEIIGTIITHGGEDSPDAVEILLIAGNQNGSQFTV